MPNLLESVFKFKAVLLCLPVACSDDDDDDEEGGGMITTPGDMTGAPEVVPATPGVGGTAYDTIVNDPELQSLEDAIIAAGLADTLDDPASEFTIFAPDNAALAAAMETLGDDFPVRL